MSVKLFAIKEIEWLMMPALDGVQLGKLHAVLSHCLPEAEAGLMSLIASLIGTCSKK